VRFVENLAREIDVATDATVSRVIVKDGPVRLVLFAFDAGQELTEHTASVPAIVQVLSGVLTVTASGETRRVVPGSWLLLEAGEPHAVVAEEPARMLLAMLRHPS
jgi:quercetin dioxygenase-like cupin family protein